MQVHFDSTVTRALVVTKIFVTQHPQVPLTDDFAREGGLLVFACNDGRLVHARRRMGAILAHDGDAVHGVTALVKGTRLVAREEGASICSYLLMLQVDNLHFCPDCLMLASCTGCSHAQRSNSSTHV